MNPKRETYEFLKLVENRLNRELPAPDEIQQKVDEIRASSAGQPSQKHLRDAESAFTNAFVVPILSGLLSTYPGMTHALARKAFLSESYRNLPDFCSGTPARRLRHPFSKGLSALPQEIYRKWCGEKNGSPLTQACPDFAICSPFPYHIIFEAKYFTSSSAATAKRELVADAYQAFFYRALPPDTTKDERPDWDYDYACLLAYDASPNGALKDAWREIDSQVKRGFWEGANVYMMIVRGREI